MGMGVRMGDQTWPEDENDDDGGGFRWELADRSLPDPGVRVRRGVRCRSQAGNLRNGKMEEHPAI